MIISIIPARMGSSRFPGKPMAKILSIPMIGHVYYRVKMCKTLAETYVAACDKEIFDYIQSIRGKAVMTNDKHERCSDRCAEAMLIPSRKKGIENVPMKKQVCVIPFKRDFLLEYNNMKPTPLEIIESVDMMRILENSKKARMVDTKYITKAVDTVHDLEVVEEMMKNDKLCKSYIL